MSHSQRIDRIRPANLIFLIDQSDSMRNEMAGAATARDRTVADTINSFLFELILKCVKSPQEGPRPYFALGVIGYRTDDAGRPVVGSALGGPFADQPRAWTTDLAATPLRIDASTSPGSTAVVSKPIWVEPHAAGGTPMCAALDLAGRIAKSWVDGYPDSFPPIVINITDGESTDGDPTPWARRLQSLATTDGNVLLFNLNITGDATAPILFPDRPDGLPADGQRLFAMSSPLPPLMVEAARQEGHQVRPGARAFGFNADLRAVVSFLNVGTAVGGLVR